MIQSVPSSFECIEMRAAPGKIKVKIKLVGSHLVFSFCGFCLKIKSPQLPMRLKRSKCGLSVLFNPKHLRLGHHIRRAALDKVGKVKLTVHHFSCLLCAFLEGSIAR